MEVGRNNNSSFTTLLIGAALGAAGLYLSDKNNRDKVMKKWNDIKDKGNQKLNQIQNKVDEGKKQAEGEIKDLQDQQNKSGPGSSNIPL